MLSLAGRGVIVSGTRRIGAGIVRRLAEEGARPAIVYRRSRDAAEELLASVLPVADKCCVIQADLTSEEDAARAVSQASDALGDLSYCVSLASDYTATPYETLDSAAWDKGLASTKAAYLLALHASRRIMQNSGPTRGQIVLFGDWAAENTPYTGFLPYLTGKAALLFMTRALALELAPQGILVNSISPGPTAKPDDISQEDWDQVLQAAPLKRESSEADIASLVVSLLKLETVTGENFRVDSGRHLAGSGG